MAKVKTFKLSAEQVRQQAEIVVKSGDNGVSNLQGLIAGMIGPSWFLIRSALDQPKDFYLDDRANGFGLYSKQAILNAVSVYATVCEMIGNVPESAFMPNLGTF